MKIWTWGSSSRSGSRNAWKRNKKSTVSVVWTTFGIFSVRSKWFPVGRDWWPWTKPGYITTTGRQSNSQWSGGIAAHPAPPPKIPSAKIRWKISRLDYLGSRRNPPHWLSSKGPNYQHRVLLFSAGAIVGHFEGKRRGKLTKGVLFLHDNAPTHRTLATQKKLAYLGFQCLDHPPYSPDLTPSDYHLFPGLKKQLKGRHFLPETDAIVASETWLDGQTSEVFWVACKS